MAAEQTSNEGKPQAKTFTRWTAKRKLQVVTELMRGQVTPAEMGRQYGITQSQMFEWKVQVLLGAEEALTHGGQDI